MLATEQCIVIAASFVGCLRLHLGQLLAAAVFVDCNEYEISAGNMQVRSSLRIFHPDVDTDLV
jgi:hypothetical protein